MRIIAISQVVLLVSILLGFPLAEAQDPEVVVIKAGRLVDVERGTYLVADVCNNNFIGGEFEKLGEVVKNALITGAE